MVELEGRERADARIVTSVPKRRDPCRGCGAGSVCAPMTTVHDERGARTLGTAREGGGGGRSVSTSLVRRPRSREDPLFVFEQGAFP